MALGTHVQTNFTSGEISPRLLGRSDLSKYTNGARVLDNFIVQQHGGLNRRPGTRYIAATKLSGLTTPGVKCFGSSSSSASSSSGAATTGAARLIPFTFSTEQSYVLEFGHNYIRFFRDGGQLVDGGVPVEVSSPYDEDDLDAIKFTQSADVLYIVHPDYKPRELQRLSDVSWQLIEYEFNDGPYLGINSDDTKTLTLSGIVVGTQTLTATGHTPFAATDVGRLVRFKSGGNKWGWMEITAFGTSSSVTVDLKTAPDAATATETWRLGAWSDTTGWPRTVVFHQERLWFGGNTSKPQSVWGSVVSSFNSFQPSDVVDSVVGDDDGLSFTLADNQVNSIRWLESVSRGLLIGTSAAEWMIKASGVNEPLSPTNASAALQGTRGSKSNVPPLKISNAVLFAQSSGRKLYESAYDFNADAYVSSDMTVLSEHITADRVKYVAYQQDPNSIVWVIDDQGGLKSMTYEKEQQVIAWADHQIAGVSVSVESIAVIREPTEDRLYMIVKRTIDGRIERYVELLELQFETGDKVDEDGFFLDSMLTYNGWNTNQCCKLGIFPKNDSSSSSSSGFTWIEDSAGRLLAEGCSPFSPASIDRRYRINGSGGAIDVEVTDYVSPTEVKVLFKSEVPSDLRSIYTYDWALTLNAVTNLDHLEGETVEFLIDGATHASRVVSNGSISLDSGANARYGAIIHAGLLYTSKFVSLPVVPAQFAQETRGKIQSAVQCTLIFHETVGARVTSGGSALDRIAFRSATNPQGQAVPLFTGRKVIDLEGAYDNESSVEVLQDQPLPMTLLSVIYEVDWNGF